MIKIDGLILFVKRNDRERPNAPNWVPPGGKLSIGDLRKVFVDESIENLLKWQQDSNFELIRPALYKTLIRKLYEDVRLIENEHYSWNSFKPIGSYQRREGKRAHHAYTNYAIEAYSVSFCSKYVF